ncbi:MAG: type II toxin-antitoxin system VapC family toxin [Acidimicrobiia bacterium]
MRLLLDSHVALWWLEGNPALGRLELPDGLVDALEAGGFLLLDVTARHAEQAPRLPLHHRDPFDRMLIAQAQLEALTLVTADRSFDAYQVTTIDAQG